MAVERTLLIVESGDGVLTAAARRAGFNAVRRDPAAPAALAAYVDDREPALILIDLDPAEREGFEAAVHLKARLESLHVPVILFKSSPAEADVLRAYDTGANSFVEMPAPTDRLDESVRILLHYWFDHVELPQAHNVR